MREATGGAVLLARMASNAAVFQSVTTSLVANEPTLNTAKNIRACRVNFALIDCSVSNWGETRVYVADLNLASPEDSFIPDAERSPKAVTREPKLSAERALQMRLLTQIRAVFSLKGSVAFLRMNSIPQASIFSGVMVRSLMASCFPRRYSGNVACDLAHLFRHCDFTERVLQAGLLWLCLDYVNKKLPELVARKLRFRALLALSSAILEEIPSFSIKRVAFAFAERFL